MPDLMGNHVGFRKLARLAAGVAGAKAPFQVLKEGSIEINLAIVRAIERSHCGLCEPAGRPCYAGKHDQSRRLIGPAGLRKDLLPLRFGAAEHGGYELRHLIRGRSRACLLRFLLLLRTASARENVGPADQNAWIYAEVPAQKSEHDDGADPDPTPPTGKAKSASVLAVPVFDVVATRQLIETHFQLSSRLLPSITCGGSDQRPLGRVRS